MTRKAVLCSFSAYGTRDQVVVVLGRTLRNYRVACATLEPIKLAGRDTWLYPGQEALVPLDAIRTIH